MLFSRFIVCTVLCTLSSIALPAFCDLTLSDGSDINMTGSTGSTIIFPDGSTMATAPSGSAPEDHGGTSTTVTGTEAFVGGGKGNTASGDYAGVSAGHNNDAQALYATISGGGPSDPDTNPTTTNNQITDDYGTIGGGGDNQAGNDSGTTTDAHFATVGGGLTNTASGTYGTVAGGKENAATNSLDTIAGGRNNIASGGASTVSGGALNNATGGTATVGGGASNTAAGGVSTIGGGSGNTTTADYVTVGGGISNASAGYGATIAGGGSNQTSGSYSTVSGGASNAATGFWSTVAGGNSNTAAGDYSFAAGNRAKIHEFHNGTFMFADKTSADFNSAAANEFAVRASGGVRFLTNSGATVGATLSASGTSWGTISAREKKENYTEINTLEVLETLVNLPVQRWNYRHQDASVQHIGPYAQDFHAAFSLNGDYTGRITTLDFDGVALAAIQGLNQKLQHELTQKQDTIEALEKRLNAYVAQFKHLDERLQRMELRADTKTVQ